jgi:MoaA/NifB/PqqE/SkfB family radical SAM enzyme
MDSLLTASVTEAWILSGEDPEEFNRILHRLAARTEGFWADIVSREVAERCQQDPSQLLSEIIDSAIAAKIVEFGDWRTLTPARMWPLVMGLNISFEATGNYMIQAVATELNLELPGTRDAFALIQKKLGELTVATPQRTNFELARQAITTSLFPDPMPTATLAAWNQARSTLNHASICHAPSTSLYFGRDGLVTACCYTRANPLGSYPTQSIEQIWFGSRRPHMCDQLAHNALPLGCEICAEQLLAHNFKGLLAANFDALAAKSFTESPAPTPKPSFLAKLFAKPVPPAKAAQVHDYPAQLEFELSNKCNLECDMCNGFFSSSIRANRENLPPLPMLYDAAFVEQLKPFIPHLKRAKFLGGEPFLIDIYYDIWELFIQLNPTCELSITTNAAVLTAKALRIIEKLNCQIVVSFDSISKATYESIRVNATFERTLENLEKIVEINQRKGKPLALAVCPMVSNWREIPEIVAFANQRGMTVGYNTVLFPVNSSLKHLPEPQQTRIVNFYRQALRTPANAIEATNYLALEDLARQIEAWSHEPATIPDQNQDLLPILA